MSEPARAAKPVNDALTDGKRKAAGRARPPVGSAGLFALQRSAGNAAVNALLAAKLKWPSEQAVKDIDGALTEMRRDEPGIDTVEKGLKAAKAVGVPVELEGPKPPPAALAVTMTGFGPGSVAPKKPVPPTKPVPAKSPLGKAAAKRAKAGGGGPRGAAPTAAPTGGGGATAIPAAPLSADQLLQPPVSPKSVAPEQDPAFKQVTGNVKAFAKDKRAHPPAASKAKEAQDAALAPTDDLAGQAKEAKVASMDAQQAGSFDKKAFIAAVKAAIEAKSPKTLTEADDYAKSGKAGEVKGEVKGLVTQGKEGQAKDIETATAAPPDTSKAVPKQVTPMGPEPQSPAAPIPAAGAVPKPAPPEQLNLEAGKHQANQEMADAEVSEQQLAQSNEPDFQQALTDKKTAAAHADTAPGEFRKQEQDVISQSKTEAAAETKAGVTGMQDAKGAALAKLVADKGKTKSKDEAKRAEVTAKIQDIFARTEVDVKKILEGIDKNVEKEFEKGEKDARADFESYVSAKMSAYKKDRYSGWLGGYRWLRDKVRGMPSKVNEFYEAGRELYLKQMDKVIGGVANIVGTELTAAKTRIAAGKTEIASYVKSLPANLQKVGAEASKEIADKFEQLEDDVKSKQESVVDTLATKYVEARKGLDERIEELQAENKGLVDKAIGAIKAIINTIRQLAAMLMNVLARVAGVVGDIIKAPVRFLGNLIDGVKGGILKFKDNILDHLRKGLMGWLFGALAEGGVELPDKFDPPGIIKLLASLFGLTWRNIRNRIVKQIGEKAMSAVEKGVEIFRIISSPAGVAGLWQMLLEKLGDIKEMILEQVKDFVITRIITAGITWLIGLLNPAAAFIKACKLIYDVIMFFVSNAERIAKFVNTVIDSAADIVRGNIGGVVAKIEDVLGQMVPILIGFLASVIGIGGIGQKIREIIGKLQKPVTKAIDFVIKTGLKLAGPVIRGLKGIGGKVKAKVAAGKAYVKGKVEAGKAWAKGKLTGKAPPATGPEATEKQRKLDAAMRGAHTVLNTYAGRHVTAGVVRAALEPVASANSPVRLTARARGPHWSITGTINPTRTEDSDAGVLDSDVLKQLNGRKQSCNHQISDIDKPLKPKGRVERNVPHLVADMRTERDALVVRKTQLDTAFEALRTGEAVEATPEQIREGYDDLKESGTHLLSRIDDSLMKSSDKVRRIDDLRGQISGTVTSAKALLADAAATVIIANPRYAGLKTEIDTLLDANEKFLAAHATPAAGLPENILSAELDAFRAQMPQSQRLGRSCDRAKQLVKPENESRDHIRRIESLCEETTKKGRPGADVGDGSSEAALKWEVENGKPYKSQEGHYLKVAEAITSLTRSVTALREIRPRVSDAALLASIDESIRQAEARSAGLSGGLAVWRSRHSLDKVWDSKGKSKVQPGWPTQDDLS